MGRWQGHLPMASANLRPILDKAAQGGTQFSLAERAIFMACEFWTAIAAQKLVMYLGEGAMDTLRYMNIIYSAIGAPNVASAVIATVGELEGSSSPQIRLTCLRALQDRLLKTEDPVDHLIARFVERLRLGAEHRSEWVSASDMDSILA